MGVFHVLKDGSRPKDITGHVVRAVDVPAVYQLMKQINRGLTNETKNTYYGEENAVNE